MSPISDPWASYNPTNINLRCMSTALRTSQLSSVITYVMYDASLNRITYEPNRKLIRGVNISNCTYMQLMVMAKVGYLWHNLVSTKQPMPVTCMTERTKRQAGNYWNLAYLLKSVWETNCTKRMSANKFQGIKKLRKQTKRIYFLFCTCNLLYSLCYLFQITGVKKSHRYTLSSGLDEPLSSRSSKTFRNRVQLTAHQPLHNYQLCNWNVKIDMPCYILAASPQPSPAPDL